MKHPEGFTLLSMMLALCLMSVSLLLVVSLSKVLVSRSIHPENTAKDCFLFFSQTGSEIHSAESVSASASGKQLTVKKDGNNITYKWLSNHRVIRQVNGLGYEIVMMHVSNILFQTHNNKLWIEVTDDQTNNYYWEDESYLQIN